MTAGPLVGSSERGARPSAGLARAWPEVETDDVVGKRFLGLALVAGLAVACGPSFQAVYECNVRFEHCYALDQRPVPPEARKECWHEWLFNYTYGQSRDRVEYAAARFSELSLDRQLPAEEAARVRPERVASAPMPTNAFAPPQRGGRGNRPPSPSASAPPRPIPDLVTVNVRAPGEECAIGCGVTWKACHAECGDRVCDGCDRAYRQCVPRCVLGNPAKR